MSNFTFLKSGFPEIHEAAAKAESLVMPDARAACFYCRRALELTVAWLYKHDRALKLPYDAGWLLDKPQDREFEVSGMPNA